MDVQTFYKKVMGIKDGFVVRKLEQNSYRWKVKKREIVVKQGDVVTELPFVVAGVMKAWQVDSNGKKRVCCFKYRPGAPVSYISNLGSDVKSMCTIEAVQDSELLCVPMNVLLEFIKNNLEISNKYSWMLSRSIQEISEYQRMIYSYDARGKYEWFLETYPGLDALVSKKDIASFLNMSPESLSRVLSKRGDN